MIRSISIVVVSLVLLAACTRNVQTEQDAQTQKKPDPAQVILQQSIAAHGGIERYDQLALAFEFRERTYKIFRKNGLFQYERIFTDSTGRVRDVLTNDAFYREIGGKEVAVHDTMQAKYAGSIGSVVYFAMLPFPLNDPAVIPKYLGERSVKGRLHHQIGVTFRQEGGGPEFEDEFMYWIDAATGYMNYMAYLYYTDEGGIRFREAYNERTVGGIRMADYVNYQGDPDSMKLEELDRLFEAGKLTELSRICSENIRVLQEMPL